MLVAIESGEIAACYTVSPSVSIRAFAAALPMTVMAALSVDRFSAVRLAIWARSARTGRVVRSRRGRLVRDRRR